MEIKGFHNEEKQCVGIIKLIIELGPKIIVSPCYIMQGALPYNLLIRGHGSIIWEVFLQNYIDVSNLNMK